MQATGTLNSGAYRAGNSFLHQLDPRLKLLLLLPLIACLFSATSPLRPLLIFLLWLAAAAACPGTLSSGWRILRLLRWLLLFTLLLHIFFTPGRTLFGTSWLSYDGLLRGLLVDAQVILAILFSLLLSWTTSPTELVWGMARLLTPLRRFKLPVQETGGLLLLVLHFFPLIQEEVNELRQQSSSSASGWLQRVQQRIALIEPLLIRLVERADQLARQIVDGKNPLQVDEAKTDGRFRRRDQLLLIAGIVVLILLWTL